MTMRAFYTACEAAGFAATCFIGFKLYQLTGGINFLWWFLPLIAMVNFGAFASIERKRDEEGDSK